MRKVDIPSGLLNRHHNLHREYRVIFRRCAPWKAKRGRVVRGRRRSGQVAAGHLQGHRHAVQLS